MPKNHLQTLGLVLLVMLLSLLLAGCTQPEPERSLPIEITDQLGRVVRLEKVPERIISLAPSNTEILFALGLGDKVVGVTEYCDFPPEAKQKEIVGGLTTPDMEKVVALTPDLILTTSIHEKRVLPELERQGLAVLALAPKTLDDVIGSIDIIGQATGHQELAEQLIKSMRQRIEAVAQRTAKIQERPRVFFIIWHNPLITAGRDSFISDLIEKAGGKNIFDDLTGYPSINLEIVLERNPQFIIAPGHGKAADSSFQWVNSETRMKETDALKNGRVYEINADLVNRPGPRLVEGLEQLFQIIHPELE